MVIQSMRIDHESSASFILTCSALLLLLSAAGCESVNTTFKSTGSMLAPLVGVEYAVIKSTYDMKDKTSAQIVVTRPTQLRIGNLENVIVGTLLKHRISTISPSEFTQLGEEKQAKCLLVEWGVSGRNTRGQGSGFSQEVTVLVRNAGTGLLVYEGTGEYMGETEIDDLRGALLAALANFDSK